MISPPPKVLGQKNVGGLGFTAYLQPHCKGQQQQQQQQPLPSSPPNLDPGPSVSSTRGSQSLPSTSASSKPTAPSAPLPRAQTSKEDLAKERRRAQNRKAQQLHRARWRQRLKELQARVEELAAMERRLRRENGELKRELLQAIRAVRRHRTVFWGADTRQRRD